MGFFEIFWSVIWIFLLVAWFWVLITVVADIFRSKDIGGFQKALWVLFVIVIPWLGVLAYILLRGDKMDEHRQDDAARIEEAQRTYVQNLAGRVSTADELEKLAALKEKGVLTEAEFEQEKQKLLGSS